MRTLKTHLKILKLEASRGVSHSVGWKNFCVEQTEAALKDRKFFVLAKDGEKYVAMGSVVGLCFCVRNN